jgi:hypothetical protein
MKKLYYILFISLFLFSCNNKNTLSVEETITKEITIPFDSLSIQNNDFIKFKLEKSEHLIVDFSKGKNTDNDFIISANDYLTDSEPIIVKLSSNVEGIHSFKLVFSELSPDLEADFTNGDIIEFPNLTVQAKWKAYILYIIILSLLLFVFIIWFIIKRKSGNSFDYGYLQISYPKNEQIELEGENKIDLVKYLNIEDDIFCTVYCEPDTKFEDKEEIDIKLPRIEIDTDMKLKVNDVENLSESAYLKNKDSISIVNVKGEEIIKLKYNEY